MTPAFLPTKRTCMRVCSRQIKEDEGEEAATCATHKHETEYEDIYRQLNMQGGIVTIIIRLKQ